MTLSELCRQQQDALLSQWTERFFASYPLDGTGFLRTQSDRFANPVGHVTSESAALLLNAVLGADVDPAAVKDALGRLVRLRAVQDLSPSQAVGPIFLLKSILRGALFGELREHPEKLDEYASIVERVDTLALMAFDMYAGDREAVFRLRVDELKRGQSQVMRWAQQKGAGDTSSTL